MNLVSVAASSPVPAADPRLVDVAALRRELEASIEGGIEGEVRFDAVSRALYSTDASVYQIEPLGVVVVRSREDLISVVRLCAKFRCPHHIARRRHLAGRSGDRRGLAGRHLEILQPDSRTQCGRTLGARRARHRAR